MRSEIPFVLVPDWDAATLGDVCDSDTGLQTGPFGSQLHAEDYVALGIPSIMPQDLVDGQVDERRVARITEEDATRLSRYRVQAGDIVYSRRGDIGRRALITKREEGWLCGTGCLRVRVGNDLDPEYLFRYLGHPAIHNWLERHAVGATMPNLNTKILAALPVAVPPRDEQHRIAWILASLDDKIENNGRIAKTLEEIASALFKARFVDFVDHDDLVESKIGPVPRGWRVIPLSDAVAINPRVAAIKKGSVVPHVGMADVPGWGMRPGKGVESREYAGGARFEFGDTLMARITGCIEHGKGAFVDFLDGPGAGSTEFLVLRAKAPLTPEMVFLLSRTPRVREHAIANMSGSSGRQRVQTSAFDHLPIAVPPNFETLAEEASLFQVIFQRTRVLWQENCTLAALRDAVLPRLISGQIRVPEAGSKEPSA